jgi:chemotaxis protein MotB
MSGEEEQKQEMLIIRRNSGDDLMAVKGGAWKIAYADFVTAMMAFFLVMWLINSANEVTKARVASYFNPIKMTDASPAKRGLMEEVSTTSPKNNVESRESTAGQGKGPGEADKAGGELKIAEHSMMLNPVSSLDAIIRHAKQESVSTGQADAMAPVGDPFDPRSMSS